MKRNDMSSIVYLIIALICLYFLLDVFKGKNRAGTMIDNFIGTFGGPAAPVTEPATATDPATSPATKPATVQGPSPVPSPLVPLPGKAEPKTKPATNTTKSGSKGFNLNDLLPHITIPSIPSPPAWMGILPELVPFAPLLAL
jgi:hypothetical protein